MATQLASHHKHSATQRVADRPGRERRHVLSLPIDVVSWDRALTQIAHWAARRESRVVCICNVHSVITAQQDNHFLRVVEGCDLATPDGMPVAWMLRSLGHREQNRVSGPDLMWRYCAEAATRRESIFLYGSSKRTLALLRRRLRRHFPGMRIAGSYSPPYGPMSREKDQAIVDVINESRAGVVFVSLGCPKQEKWMAEHRGRINAVMIGVGAAFDYHAGVLPRAPRWMQDSGLEWLHRLGSEPRRLYRRYLVTNTLFVAGVTRQLLQFRRTRERVPAWRKRFEVDLADTGPRTAIG